MNGLITVKTRDLIPEMVPKRKGKKQPYRKPEAVKQLEALADAEARRLHPACPHIVSRVFRDDKAGPLTNCIVKYATLRGAFASRINSQGTFNRKLGRYIPSTAKRGLPDIQILYKGLFIGCEVKIKADRQSEYQKKIQAEIESSGGTYFLAKDFSSFKTWFDSLINE